MIIKYAIANMDSRLLAKEGLRRGLAGSVSNGYGFGKWGVEPTVYLEMAVSDPAESDRFVCHLLWMSREKCAYRTVDGLEPKLLYTSGKLEDV